MNHDEICDRTHVRRAAGQMNPHPLAGSDHALWDQPDEILVIDPASPAQLSAWRRAALTAWGADAVWLTAGIEAASLAALLWLRRSGA